jgi:outer membrane receptor protein involved in Fe transport
MVRVSKNSRVLIFNDEGDGVLVSRRRRVFPRLRHALLGSGAIAILSSAALAGEPPSPPPAPALANNDAPEQVLVTARRNELIGVATTSSQGIILKQELNELPVFRSAQLLETVPGLVVTSHSGEGKANQYLLRGFNLDHGTDIATSVDGMPVNMRTHAHGQGYTDMNFFIPELASGIEFTKGPYFAQHGDFSSVATVRIGYINEIPNQTVVTLGTLGYQRLFAAGTKDALGGRVMSGLEVVHYDGPWQPSNNVRKVNAVFRYSQGEANEGFSITGMYYRGLWNAITDQPRRALDPPYTASLGISPISRFGTLDPTDAGQAQRMSLSGVYSHGTLDWHVDANAFLVNSNLTLWNNFTHFLEDPMNGDQRAQNDVRMIYGGGASYTRYDMLFGTNTEVMVGVQGRFDDIHTNRIATLARKALPNGTFEDDRVRQGSAGVYVQFTDYVTDWLRVILGAREDFYSARSRGTTTGTSSADMFQPKASIVVSPFANWEFYASAGRGFHSNDARGVSAGGSFLSASKGAEVGIRASPLPELTATLTFFQMDFNSELTYDPDAGTTDAGRPSRRRGIELNTTYAPYEWLEIYGSIAFAHGRYRDFDPAGAYIPDAPSLIGQLGVYIRDAGPWYGALNLRYLGHHPLTNDNLVRSPGYKEWNISIGYNFESGWRTQLGVFNLLDTRNNAADYYYATRITPAEPLAAPEGNLDRQFHPLEPRSVRLTVTKTF